MSKELYPYKVESGAIHLYIKAIPNASRNKIGKILSLPEGDHLKIYITTAPEDGKANIAIIDLLAKEIGLAKSAFSIIKGSTSAHKVVLIKNTEPETILALRVLLNNA